MKPAPPVTRIFVVSVSGQLRWGLRSKGERELYPNGDAASILLRETDLRDKDKVSHLLLDKQVAVTQDNGRPHRQLPESVVIHDSFCLGDLIYLGAMLAALREQAPGLPVSVVVGGIARDFPFFERIGVRLIELAVPWDDRRWYKRPFYTLKGLPRAAKGLRSLARESLLADPRGDLRHVAVATLAGRRTLSSLSRGLGAALGPPAESHIRRAERLVLEASGFSRSSQNRAQVAVDQGLVHDA